MDNQIVFSDKDTIIMKLLHYFITDKNYKPVVLKGIEDEIWLENMDSDYKIIRIVTHYIHNEEQLSFDLFRTKKIVKSIEKKIVSFNVNTLSIFLNLGENVSLHGDSHIDCIYVDTLKDLQKYSVIKDFFPDINKKLVFNEKGVELFLKITDDIQNKNKKEAARIEKIFTMKKPIITYILIALNVIVFLLQIVLGNDYMVGLFATYGPFVRAGEYYRLFTGAFLHADIIHIAFNMYALYVIGSQAENFFGKIKYLVIYIFSILTSSLLSILLNVNSFSVGASGAIFGLLGAMLYFGYNFRVYLGNTLVRQILPIIIVNLLFGFLMPSVDNYAHIGGLIGGLLISIGLGLRVKEEKGQRLNGIILSLLFVGFLIFMNFFYIK